MKNILLETDKLFSKLELESVVMYPNDIGNACVSCHTNDDLAYVFVQSKKIDYTYKEFAFRNWSSIHSVISSFWGNMEELKISVFMDKNDYPQRLNISNNRINMNYYLQNYSFISNQQDLLNVYKKKKFQLGNIQDGFLGLTQDIVKDINRMSSLTLEKQFYLKTSVNGTYVVFGDENQTVDNGSIKVSDESLLNVDKSFNFNIDYFLKIYSALCGNDFKCRFLKDKIVMTSETDEFLKVAIIRGISV